MTRSRTPVTSLAKDELTGTSITDAHDIDGHDREISLGADLTLEELRDALNKPGAIDIDAPDFKRMADELDFMEERVLVRVEESNEKNAEKIINVFNDGIPQRFVRGEWTIAKRKYVEVLARSKPMAVSTPETLDGNGDRTTAIRTSVGLLYPFTMRDKNPIGQTWLNRIKSEA